MDALREHALRPLTAADLASIPDFLLGSTVVSPSRRMVTGPGGTAELQPRVMQVLVALFEHAGAVVSRDSLFERCWGQVYVGDDSLNRVIAALRRLGAETGCRSFAIETVPRIGYRLTETPGQETGRVPKEPPLRMTRRQMAGAGMGVAALGAVGGWAALRLGEERSFERMLREGDAAFAGEESDFKPDVALRSFEAAVRMKPRDPRGLGRLALMQSFFALYDKPARRPAFAAAALETARRTLSIDRQETNALLALWELQGSTLDWWTRDQRLRQIIATDRSAPLPISELSSLLMAAGMVQESWVWNERDLRLAPLSQTFLGRRVHKLWVFGRQADADNVIDQARAQFPKSQWIWSTRFLLYAFTDRPRVAQRMMESDPGMLQAGPERLMWSASLDALAQRSPERVGKVRKACISAAETSAELAPHAVMILGALGDIDTAFDIANGSLLSRGLLQRGGRRAEATETGDALKRTNCWYLFWPPCKELRADARFRSLCEGIGLLEYWRRRGVQPDYLRLDGFN